MANVDTKPHKVLRRAVLREQTAANYLHYLAEFERFCRKRRLSLSVTRIGDSFERYFWSRASIGLGVQAGRNAFYGYLHFRAEVPRVPTHLTGAQQALQGWAKLVTDCARDGVPEEVIYYLAGVAMDLDWLFLAALLLVQMV